MADLESFDDILNALDEVQKNIANVVSGQQGKIRRMINGLERIASYSGISDIPELTGFESIQPQQISRNLEDAFRTVRQSFRALYGITEAMKIREELASENPDALNQTFASNLNKVIQAIQDKLNNMFDGLINQASTLATEFDIPEENVRDFLSSLRNVSERNMVIAGERIRENIRRQFELPTAFTERFIGDMESTIRDYLGEQGVERRQPEFQNLRDVARQLETALYDPEVNRVQTELAKRMPETIDNIQNVFSKVEDIFTRQYQRQYELTKLETIKDVLQTQIEGGGLNQQVASVFQTAIRTIQDEQNRIVSDSINDVRSRLSSFIQAHTKTFMGLGVQFEVGEFPPMEFDLVRQRVNIPDLFGRIGGEISDLLGEIEQGIRGISVGGLEDVFRTTISDIDTRMNQIRESIARQRERLETEDLPIEERDRIRRRVEIEEATLTRLEQARDRIGELFPILTGDRPLTPQERFRFGTVEPLREAFTWLGQVSLQNLMFSGLLGSTMILFEALAMFPTQTAYQSLLPVYSVFGGMTGFSQLTQTLQGFAYNVPAIIDQLQSYMNTITGITGSFEFTRDAIGTALEVARIEPIQFSEALEVLTAGTIYPELRQGIRDPEFQRMLFETVQLLSILAPEQGVQGALFSIREMFGGNFRSLQLRFNIDPEIISQYAGADRSLRDMTGVELIETLNRGLRNIFSGDEVLIRQGLQFDVQIRNIVDTLISSVIRPLLEPQQALQEYINQLLNLRVTPQGELDVGFLELTAPNFAKRLQRMYDRAIEEGATPEEALTRLQIFTGTTLGSPLQLLSFGLLQINNIIDEVLSRSGITEAFGNFILGLANNIQNAIFQYQYMAIDDPTKAGQVFAKNLGDIIREGFVQFDTFLEQTGLSAIVREIADIGRTAMRTMFRDVMKEVFIGLGDVMYNLPADFTDAMIGIAKSQVQGIFGGVSLLGSSVLSIFGLGEVGLTQERLEALGLSQDQINAILENQVSPALVSSGLLIGQTGGLIQFGGLTSIVTTIARGIRDNTAFTFRTYRELTGGLLLSHIGQEMQAIGQEIQSKGIVDWNRIFGLVAEGLITGFAFRGTAFASDIRNVISRIRVLPQELPTSRLGRFLGLDDVVDMFGVARQFNNDISFTFRRLLASAFGNFALRSGALLGGAFEFGEALVEGESLPIALIRGAISGITTGIGSLIGGLIGGLSGNLLIAGGGAIAGGSAGAWLGGIINDFLFGSRIPEIDTTVLKDWDKFVSQFATSRIQEFNRAFERTQIQAERLVEYGLIDRNLFDRFNQNVKEFNETFVSSIETTLKDLDDYIGITANTINQAFGRQIITERRADILTATIVKDPELRKTIEDIYTDIAKGEDITTDNIRIRLLQSFSRRDIQEISRRTGLDENQVTEFLSTYTRNIAYNIDVNRGSVIEIANVLRSDISEINRSMFQNLGVYTSLVSLAQIQYPTFEEFNPQNIGNVFTTIQNNIVKLQEFAKGVGGAFGDISFVADLSRMRGDNTRFRQAREKIVELANSLVETYGIEAFSVMLMQDRGFQQLFLPVISQTAQFDKVMDIYMNNINKKVEKFKGKLNEEKQKLEEQGISVDTSVRFNTPSTAQELSNELQRRINEVQTRINDYRENINKLIELQTKELEFNLEKQDIGIEAETGFINENVDRIKEITRKRLGLGLLKDNINLDTELEFINENAELIKEITRKRLDVSSAKQLINLEVQMERFSDNIRENINRAITGQFNIEGLTVNPRFIDPLLLGFTQDVLSPNQLFNALSNTYGRLLRTTNEMNRVSVSFGNVEIPNLAGIYSQMVNTFQKSFGTLPDWLTNPQLLETVVVYDLLAGNDINKAMKNVNKVIEQQLNRLRRIAEQLGINFEVIDLENVDVSNMVRGLNQLARQTNIQNRKFTEQVMQKLDISSLQEFWANQGLTMIPDFSIDMRTFAQNPTKALTDFGKQLLQVPKLFDNQLNFLRVGLGAGFIDVAEADDQLRFSLGTILNNFNKLPEAVRFDPRFIEQMYILGRAYNMDVSNIVQSYREGLTRYRQSFTRLDRSLSPEELDEKLMSYRSGLGQVQTVNISAGNVYIRSG